MHALLYRVDIYCLACLAVAMEGEKQEEELPSQLQDDQDCDSEVLARRY